MSTDTYIDMYRNGRPAKDDSRGWDNVAWETDFETERIGYVFILNGLRFDLKRWLEEFSIGYPMITPTSIEVIVAMLRYLRLTVQEVMQPDHEWERNRYQVDLDGPGAPPWDDVIEPADLQKALEAHMGWHWSVRVD